MNYDKNGALLGTSIPELSAPKSGKVRDVYDLGDSILFVSSKHRLSRIRFKVYRGITNLNHSAVN